MGDGAGGAVPATNLDLLKPLQQGGNIEPKASDRALAIVGTTHTFPGCEKHSRGPQIVSLTTAITDTGDTDGRFETIGQVRHKLLNPFGRCGSQIPATATFDLANEMPNQVSYWKVGTSGASV